MVGRGGGEGHAMISEIIGINTAGAVSLLLTSCEERVGVYRTKVAFQRSLVQEDRQTTCDLLLLQLMSLVENNEDTL